MMIEEGLVAVGFHIKKSLFTLWSKRFAWSSKSERNHVCKNLSRMRVLETVAGH